MAARPLRLATRGSPLALAQAHMVADALARRVAGCGVELVVVETTGDRRLEAALHEIGGQGVFTTEVEAAVAEARAEAAVHSAKDLPSRADGALRIVAVLPRGDARDALVGRSLSDLAPGATVATGSVRRRAQLAWLRPDLVFSELRGNIGTRLTKVPAGGAVVVAMAALERLGRSHEAAEVLSPTLVLPQVGQGTIAVTARPDDEETRATLSAVDDLASRQVLEAERAFLAELGGGCELPVGCYGVIGADGTLRLEAMVASLDGHLLVRQRREGPASPELGTALAVALLRRGGEGLLEWAGLGTR